MLLKHIRGSSFGVLKIQTQTSSLSVSAVIQIYRLYTFKKKKGNCSFFLSLSLGAASVGEVDVPVENCTPYVSWYNCTSQFCKTVFFFHVFRWELAICSLEMVILMLSRYFGSQFDGKRLSVSEELMTDMIRLITPTYSAFGLLSYCTFTFFSVVYSFPHLKMAGSTAIEIVNFTLN